MTEAQKVAAAKRAANVVTSPEVTSGNVVTYTETASGHRMYRPESLELLYAEKRRLQEEGLTNVAESGWPFGAGEFIGTVSAAVGTLRLKDGVSALYLVELSDIIDEAGNAKAGKASAALPNSFDPSLGEMVSITVTERKGNFYAKVTGSVNV